MAGLLTATYDPNTQPPEDSHMASRHAARAKNTYWNERNFAIVDSLKSEAAELDVSVPQLVLAWTLARPQITSVIVGSSRPEQVASNAAAVDVSLPEQVLERLDAL